ncbi:MAG: Uma2 family endonuclease [Planctomycetota bacterium]|jgi:Uma2 family endonuclease
MSSAEKSEWVSVEDYLANEAIASFKSEYIDGWVRAMTGATNRHNQVKLNAVFHLMRSLRGQPCKVWDSDTKVRIQKSDRCSFYYPDLQVVCDSNPPSAVYQDAPVLIMEVLSPSTRRYDLDEKMMAYLQIASLEYYVLLEQHQPIAIVMRRDGNAFVREIIEGIDARIDLARIGCSLAMQEIYEGIEFTPTCVQETDPEYHVA